MPSINVARKFTLNLASNAPGIPFTPGRHDVTDEIANHWYVKANLVSDDPVERERIATESALSAEAHGRSVAHASLEAAEAKHAAEIAEAVQMIDAANTRAEEAEAALAAKG